MSGTDELVEELKHFVERLGNVRRINSTEEFHWNIKSKITKPPFRVLPDDFKVEV